MTWWRAYAWTAVVVANWLVIGYTFLWIRRDIVEGRSPRATWLIPAATLESPDVRELQDEGLSVSR